MAAENIVKDLSKADKNWFIQNSRYKNECDRNSIEYYAEKRGREEGLQVGIQQGEQKKAEETAIKMINKNYPLSDITEMTGLPEAKVQELQKKIKPVVPQA